MIRTTQRTSPAPRLNGPSSRYVSSGDFVYILEELRRFHYDELRTGKISGALAVDIRERVTEDVAVLEPLGRMVLSDEPADTVLKDRVSAQLRDGRRQFVFDLNQVSQMDTIGLTALVTAYIAVQKAQGRIALVNPQRRVRELLRITKLDTLFQVFDREDDAIASLKRRPQAHS